MRHLPVIVPALLLAAAACPTGRAGEIHAAIERGKIRRVRELLTKDPTIANEKDENGWTPLHRAAWEKRDAIARLLLERGADVDARNKDGWTPLHRAARYDYTGIAKLLLDHGADINARDEKGWTPLHLVASGEGYKPGFDSREIMELLIERGADLEATGKEQRTPLHVAAYFGKAEAIKLLLERKADMSARAEFGRTPLHLAAGSKRTKAVAALLEAGSAVDARDANEFTPLYFAAASGAQGVLRLLLARGADVNARGKGGRTPLHVAARNSEMDTIRKLLESGADLLAKDDGGSTPRVCAGRSVAREKSVAIKMLREAEEKARRSKTGPGDAESVDRPDERGRTPLHRAAAAGSREKVADLLERGASIEAVDRDGLRPLHLAVAGGRTESVRLLLEKGADPDARTADGRVPLALARELRGRIGENVCVLLLRHGADHTKAPDLLRWAAERDHVGLLKALIRRGADLHAKDADGHTPLHYAEKAGATGAVKWMGSLDSKKEAAPEEQLLWAVKTGYARRVERLLAAHPELAKARATELLAQAIERREHHLVRALLRGGADPNHADSKGHLALPKALRPLDLEMLRLLLEHKANPNLAGKAHGPPLFPAIGGYSNAAHGLRSLNKRDSAGRARLEKQQADSVEAVRMLLEAGADPNLKGDPNRGNSLHAAAWAGSTEIAKLLLEHGADPKARNYHGKSPLRVACECYKASPAVLRLLIETGQYKHELASSAKSLLNAASHNKDSRLVEVLLDAGIDLPGGGKDLAGALYRAAGAGDLERVKLLVARGAEIDARKTQPGTEWVTLGGRPDALPTPQVPEEKGVTPLYAAVKSGKVKTAEFLLEKGASTSVLDNRGKPLLHHAACHNDPAMVELLVRHGADVNVRSIRTEDGETISWHLTPLHLAASYGYTWTAKALIDHGADVEAMDSKGQTPLYYAIRRGHGRVAALLRKHGAHQVDVTAAKLIEAVRDGKLEPVRRLILSDRTLANCADPLGMTPLHHAAERGDAGMVKFLLDQGAQVDAPDKRTYTPLHRACRRRKAKVVEVLLKHKADVNSLATPDGAPAGTPLLAALRKGSYAPPETRRTIVRLLLEHGADASLRAGPNGVPLYAASGRREREIIKLLLDHGADPRARTQQGYTALHRTYDHGIMELLLQQGAEGNAQADNGLATLHTAVFYPGAGAFVELLLRHKADLNVNDARGNTPLHYAARRGRLGAVELLVEKGADINALRNDGLGPLHLARINGHKEVTDLLKGRGAKEIEAATRIVAFLRAVKENDPDALENILVANPTLVNTWSDRRVPPLHEAVQRGHHKAVDVLLRRGAAADVLDRNGWTPLLRAVLCKDVKMVKLLLDYGADTTRVDKEGRTALDLANAIRHVAIAKLLGEAEPDPGEEVF